MSLINYVEPISIGDIFVGFGVFLFIAVLSFIIWGLYRKLIQWWSISINREIKYGLIEEVMLDETAKEKGIDLNKELLKRNVMRKHRKSIRQKIEDEMFKKTFNESPYFDEKQEKKE